MRRLPLFLATALAIAAATFPAAAQNASTATVDPALPTTADGLLMHVELDPNQVCWHQGSVWKPVQVSGRTVKIVGETQAFADPLLCTPHPFFDFQVPALPAGSWSVEVSYDGVIYAARAFEVTAPSDTLALRTERFAATARWHGSDGKDHVAQAVSTSDESGYFWFFDARNVELTLKLLDGRALNNRYWVFIASMTDVAYTVTVTDLSFACVTTPCPNVKTYTGVAGKNRNFLDTEAF